MRIFSVVDRELRTSEQNLQTLKCTKCQVRTVKLLSTCQKYRFSNSSSLIYFYKFSVPSSVLRPAAAPLEGRLNRSVPGLPAIKPERVKTAKALVEKAVKVSVNLRVCLSVCCPP